MKLLCVVPLALAVTFTSAAFAETAKKDAPANKDAPVKKGDPTAPTGAPKKAPKPPAKKDVKDPAPK